MLDTRKLCEAVTHQPQTARRIIPVAKDTLKHAASLADGPCRGKSVAKIVSHGVANVLAQMAIGPVRKARFEALAEAVSSVKQQSLVNVGVTLSHEDWAEVQKLADDADLSPTATVRALTYIAMEQAYNELSGR